jgi:hypothetical protein
VDRANTSMPLSIAMFPPVLPILQRRIVQNCTVSSGFTRRDATAGIGGKCVEPELFHGLTLHNFMIAIWRVGRRFALRVGRDRCRVGAVLAIVARHDSAGRMGSTAKPRR